MRDIAFFSCLGDSHPQGPGDLHACTLSLTFSRPMGDLLTESLDHLSAGTLHRSPGYTIQHHAHQSFAYSLRLGCSCRDPFLLLFDDSLLFRFFRLQGCNSTLVWFSAVASPKDFPIWRLTSSQLVVVSMW